MRLVFTAFAVLLVAAISHADPSPTPTPMPTTPPQMVRVPGEPVHFVLSDGREAQVFIVRRPPTVATVPFGLSETTCVLPETAKLKCEFELPARIQVIRIKWSKHSDPKKIGKTVNFADAVDLDDLVVTSVKQQIEGLDEAKGMNGLRLRCDDFTWLTGTPTAPASFSMAMWSAERMTSNPETGAPENRVTSGHYSPELVRVDDQRLELVKTGTWFSDFDPDVRSWFLGADIIAMMTSPTAQTASCQISLKPNFSIAQQQRQEYERKYTTEEPYLDGSDDLFDKIRANPRSLFYQALRLPEGLWK